VERLTNAQARRVVLAAQGFAEPRPGGAVDVRHLRKVLARTRLLQIDSVYVLERAHYVPVYSRLGAYPRAVVDKVAYGKRRQRELFEYWGHAASLLPVETFPLLRWRMDNAEQHAWGGMQRVARDNPGLVDRLYDTVAAEGPVTARQLEEEGPRAKDNWGWNWSDTKQALEWLFRCGRISVAARPSFERVYDLTERVIPEHILAAPVPDRADATRQLMVHAAQSLGVSTEEEMRDYYRLPVADSRAALRELVDAGTLRRVTVDGWTKPTYVHGDLAVPRRIRARALLSPFDPVVWHRDRVLRLWDFFYRIEIYVPQAKRVHGYYVLPFLLGDRLVGRVDLKADRAAGVLRVPAAWREPHVDGDLELVARELAAELRVLAGWLGLPDIAPPSHGDLAPALTVALAANP
jgi:uncharacterized protein YcaQ